MYERNGEWSGQSIKATAAGWTIEFWSRIQGGTDGKKLLYPYGGDFPQGGDLNAAWNEHMTYGDALIHRAVGDGQARGLRHGQVVR